jgi:hypothetical protein
LAILAVGPHGPLRVNVSAPSVVAGFQVIIDGRFWVITEARRGRNSGERLLQIWPELLKRVFQNDIINVGLDGLAYAFYHPKGVSLLERGQLKLCDWSLHV